MINEVIAFIFVYIRSSNNFRLDTVLSMAKSISIDQTFPFRLILSRIYFKKCGSLSNINSNLITKNCYIYYQFVTEILSDKSFIIEFRQNNYYFLYPLIWISLVNEQKIIFDFFL